MDWDKGVVRLAAVRIALLVCLSYGAFASGLHSQAPQQQTSSNQGAPQRLPGSQGPQLTAQYVGSRACQACHAEIYARWEKTPMANVVRDPRQHPEAIIPDLATNNVKPFTRDDIGLVYGSLWKQRYFTRINNDYYPQEAQWEIGRRVWSRYFVTNGTDWWAGLYPPDNMKRPTSALCDGCHSVNFNIENHTVTEWNVGCERCHGPGSEHVANPVRGNIQNPARMDSVHANDVCIQCHSQGQPLTNPIEGKYYDWPVGFHVGLNLQDYWKLEEHKLGETTFMYFPDGTAHKNRMQGNDFVQSVMYRRGVTCYNCHDVHGTPNNAQLRQPINQNQLCLTCHAASGPFGPHNATLEEHMQHKAGTPGGRCVDCHMPRIETEIAQVMVRAHTFRFTTPSMTDAQKIPNPCMGCHTDKTTAWATDALRHWPGRSPWRME